MPPVTGVNFLVQVEETAMPGTYRTIGGQRGGTLSRGTDEADTTNKDSSGFHEGLPTIRNWSIDFDALLLESDAAYLDLDAAWSNNIQVNVRVVMPGGETYTGLATITDLVIEGPHDDAATVSGTLTGSAVLTKV